MDYARTPATPAAPGQQAAVTKAQQFEDEKRRIVQSCFSRQDADGSTLEDYITHCRVLEDGSSSEPPPPGAPMGNGKARVIMVAVRKSGRVRMHKGRENPNGSFSIGKTWNLDDLQCITTYPAPNEKGFTVTILKAYYWQANTAKEKDFFIYSLVKIYKKYTGGKVPELLGPRKAELDALMGPGGAELLPQEEMRSPVASTGGSLLASAPSSLPPSLQATPRNAPSMESLNKPSRIQPYAGQRVPGEKPPPSPSTMRPPGSSSGLSGRRTPVDTAPSRHTPPPVPQVVPQALNGRRPSDGSSTRSGQSRTPSSSRGPPPSEDDRSMRRAPSQERYRTASINSQQSQESRREAMEQYPPYQNNKMPGPSPTPPPQESHSMPKPKANKDAASHFRLAANAYGLSSQLGTPKARPKTPTTPTTYTSQLTKEPLSMSPEAPPVMPQIKYPQERNPSGDQSNGSRSRSRSGSRRPSGDEPQQRSRSRPSREQQPSPAPAEIPPLVPREPSSKNDIRGRPPPSRENSQSSLSQQASLASALRGVPVITEPALMIRKPTFPLATPTISPPAGEQTIEVPAEKPSVPDSGSLMAPKGPIRARSRSRKRRSDKSSYLHGIDKSGMSVDIEELLQEFNWDAKGKIDQLKADVRKELSRVESNNVIINVDGDDRVDQLSVLLDQAIKECEEMDGLLTLYAVELTSLNDDITHIENQSQGLQLQTANQKTLQKELQTLLDTISISPAQMEILRKGSMDAPRGLEQIEQTLVSLYKAMRTIEPTSTHDPSSPRIGRRGSFSDEGVGSMRALQERKEEYRNSCRAFLARLRQFLNNKFQSELTDIKRDAQIGQVNSGLHPRMIGHDKAYQAMWKFAGLITFARDVDGDEYVELRKLYGKMAKSLMMEEIREQIGAWKKISKKPTQEEQDLIFNAPEKEESVTASLGARKLTVKKSIARIRTGGGSFSSNERPSPGIIASNAAFAGAFGEIYQLVFKEQNFVVEFFHLSSRNSSDFVEFVTRGPPETRRLNDLGGLRTVEPDKLKAKVIYEYMGELFSFLLQDLQNMVDWATLGDATQGVGIMYAVEQKIATVDETDQEFLAKMLQTLHDRLAGLFARFLDEQVKAIEDTKVKIKKRKGVIQFMRVFPGFAARIEEQIPYNKTIVESDDLSIREMVNEGYIKINKAMFESLQAIAKESPAVASQNVDPEDKEQLNYHIMMIENMHHYLEEVDTKGNEVLEGFRKKADEEYREHMGLYIGAVIRRPLAKLLDFVENVEALIASGTSAEDIAGRSAHNKAAFKKVLEHHAESKDIRKGIEQLKKRVDKHFGDGDESALSQKLVDKILLRLEDEFINVHKRIMLLLVGPYKESGLECEFKVNDVKVAFKK